VVVIVTLLCVNRIGTRGVILNPFYGFSKILSERNVHFLRGIVSNIILYVPYGMICFIFKNRVRKSNNLFIVVPSTFLFSFFIESLQYIFSVGYFEIEDIWCNVLGGLIGSSVIALLMLVTNQLKNIIKGEKYDIQ
jgi:glycopeptide antibiotics resistance protein